MRSTLAFSGIIVFIGLVVPHALRLILGPGHSALLPASLLGGALVMAALGQPSDTEGSSTVTVGLRAPSVEGRYRWTVKYLAPDLEVPHEEARSTFAFAAAARPEHVVTVEALTKEGREPIPEARLVLRPHVYQGSRYSSRTDETGVARVHVPKGEACANRRRGR